ncbi:MAG: pilus assembly PilX N-terminal domain-containing protein [Phycisphaerae bacterium]|nr:pilus assembly PilX N-terminal domain-containing protein [Phycisphaerae bacterium]MDD5380354.1 pilus assembly PilX N-terminal domain-containing protein [Phycisphaerae bacterium]
MKIRVSKSNKGIVLVAVIVFILILTILGFSVLSIADSEAVLARKDVNKAKAFYLAEAGLGVFAASGQFASIPETALGEGNYRVDFDISGSEPCAVATGTVMGQVKRIQVTVSFLAPPYENAIYAGGAGGSAWTLMLRGTGNPVQSMGVNQWGQPVLLSQGGKDIVNGNMFVDGDVALYEQSKVDHAPTPNTYGLNGDVSATGKVNLYDSATISGDIAEHSGQQASPDLVGMDYAVNNTHNVSQIFADAGVTQGYLPAGNELRDVFEINPSDGTRRAACASTINVDDYFFEPSSGFIDGTPFTGATPLHMGADRVYYVDGDLWVHSDKTKGFLIDGKVTIVATGNIHLCDNLQYADADSMLGLVALGKYNGSGKLIKGGNIYFGDPVNGTVGYVSAMMFAANDFLYNTAIDTTILEEPKIGFTVMGNLSALNNVSIERDWYTDRYRDRWGRWVDERRPARYNPSTNKWYDSVTGAVLTSTEVNTLKHYQMIVNYDDRVWDRSTQPPGLPKGTGIILSGELTDWEELP